MTALQIALWLLAIGGLSGTSRLAYEHRTALLAALHAVAAFGHGRRSRPISRPHPFRQHHHGSRAKPRKAIAA